ncbi:MAG TPA: GNAT family N-acetyltransferase [Caulobacterales bacterium]|nr:GNAT family N-acetyltransferase [Caulobacterales bacterium]
MKLSDRPDWEELWARYCEFYNQHLDPVVIETTWARLHDPAEPMFALVAEHAGILVGLVQCVLHRGTWAVNNICYLEDLFVASEMRNHGIGKALIEAVYARADELQCDRVYWLTHEANKTARALYDQIATRTGFIQYRRDPPRKG